MQRIFFTVATLFATLFFTQQVMAQSYKLIEKAGIKMHVFTSKPTIFEVTSVVLEGKKEVVLVDAQFSKEEAQRVAELIRSTGKKLTTIFISYSDPDFYFGLVPILQQFPQAKVYSTAQTAYLIRSTQQEKTAIWSPRLGGNAPERIVVPAALPQEHFMLENTRIEVKRAAGDAQHAFLWIPSARTLLGGIYLTAGEHPWVADSQSKEERAQWLAGLQAMEELRPEYAIPAHFAAGKANLKGSAPIVFTKQYLVELEQVLATTANSEEVVQKMKTLYPELGGVSNLEMTAKVLKGELPWKTAHAFPAIGRKAEVNFGGDFVFDLHFEDDRFLNFTGTTGSLKGVTDRMEYTAVEVAPQVYMVYWSEPKNGSHVVHVEDFGAGAAYTNISAPDGSFTNLKGSLRWLP